VRDGRRRHGLTQAQLAARARTSQAAISRLERDLVSPSVETLRTLLDLMGEELVLAARAIDYGHDHTLLRQNLARTRRSESTTGARWRTSSFATGEAGVATEFQPRPILRTLIAHDVDFVVIGGIAGMARGSSYPS
jgi:transcriptional regulator with XRE-family HTH domain